jgi:23S rRNA (pseudouridine1915-N3)-methyltransferase
MKLGVCCIGKLKDDAERSIVQRYLRRFEQLAPSLGLAASVPVFELPESRAGNAAARKSAEAAEIRKKLPADARLVMLDEHGRTPTSAAFAGELARSRDDGVRNLCIIIGGPDGLDPEFLRTASMCLSFGRMTLPHGLVRVVLAEQLYRAATILAGHPYHRE